MGEIVDVSGFEESARKSLFQQELAELDEIKLADMKEISLVQLKEKMLNWYYQNDVDMDSFTECDKTRPLYILKLKDNYHREDTFVFSLQGSPPKGRAIYIANQDYYKAGRLVFIDGHGKISQSYQIEINFDDKIEANARVINFNDDNLPEMEKVETEEDIEGYLEEVKII